ncbi:lysosome membrane protein 2 [Episyrphus balteatus]|uniref:lysosome membrane protein 2 n=1 Tax=Episyrphus balteatus TaxID=286459 RepID=UPI002485C934|nr:lysosome membrane protein 2 [Episyrphus balteatus]XP_055847865.1 lysosome membrane protein 2 [Episyrphus balteatus]XP_055847866.1 lysosome membrane protein 2 [Episyrphus balteatus]
MKLLGSNKRNNIRILKCAAIGLGLLTTAILVVVLNPVQMVADYKLTMYEGSFLYKLWQKPPLDVFIKVFMFNVTNYDRFVRGLDAKLKVEEIGPYVYQEFLEHHNATFNANDTLSYNPLRKVKFIREQSIGDPKTDMIISPNIPYMGVTAAASSISVFMAFAVRTLVRQFDAKIMLRISVHEYLWGYEDPLVNIASKLVPSVINFQKFGLLDRMFDEGRNLVTIKLPHKPGRKRVRKDGEVTTTVDYGDIDYEFDNFEPQARDFSIDNWNGLKGLKHWGYEEGAPNTACNTLQGSFDGTLFPKNMSRGDTFRVYRKAFCRTLPVIYSHPGTLDGVDAYFFKLAEYAFDTNASDSQTACFCKDKMCLKKGLGKITPCYYNIPSAISFPHFFNADPSLFKSLEGLSPDVKKHGTEIVIQPQLGVPMRVFTRFQVNLLMGEISFNSEMSKFKNMVLPIFWLEIGVEKLTPELILLLQLLFNVCPYVQMGFAILMGAAGVATIGFASLLFLCVQKPIKPLRDIDQKFELRRYSGAYLFPIIKKEISKFADEDDAEQLQSLTEMPCEEN